MEEAQTNGCIEQDVAWLVGKWEVTSVGEGKAQVRRKPRSERSMLLSRPQHVSVQRRLGDESQGRVLPH
jgi:hypothetical protein